MPNKFHPGQRWISESEPELGLGSVQRVTARTVTLAFPASDEIREYALDNAPLRRVRIGIGETVTSIQGEPFTVQSVIEAEGLLLYRDEKQRELSETELSAATTVSEPEKRLLAGQGDPPDFFDLRLAALKYQHQRRKSNVRGFVGGRIDLIPHQLFITSEVARRLAPRVLLADEVGLGKTIEACLILHRLILIGRAQRILILVPESLVHQWFVELLRRFNLWFHIYDEERCEAIEAAQPDANPFLDDQLILASLSLLTSNDQRWQQAISARWDILVVDEAHHLGWSPEVVSREYTIVEALARATPGLLLLTATPEQLGIASHFARLRLLDPNRFYDLNEFREEAQHYREVARLAEELLSNQPLSPDEIATLTRIIGRTDEGVRSLEQVVSGQNALRQELIDSLLDRHGTGRVMFRNTRATVSGFPKRKVEMQILKAPDCGEEAFELLADEFAADLQDTGAATFQPDFSRDLRMDWLAELLRRLENDKVLLICRTQSKAEAIDAALRQRLNLKMALFHESLPLVQRDRNAAWFAEEDGARLLICSEIGSEGRNFQFAHHLVLFDLPLDPELLEQRIGRLDRIGQAAEIHVHVPFIQSSPQEVLARWYQEGLNAFEKNLHGGRELFEQFGSRVRDLAQDFHETETTTRAELGQLISETQAARKELATRLEEGRDRLLELNSFRSDVAAALVRDIQSNDKDMDLDDFMLSVFDHHSIAVEEIAPRTYHLGSAGVFADLFPGLPSEGLNVTADRQRALSREDVQFLSWDHPLVTGALDLLLGSEKGNSSFARWPDATKQGLYLEAIYVLECIAPPTLHIDRFLPPTPLRVLVDHGGDEVGSSIPSGTLARHLKSTNLHGLIERIEIREELLPELIDQAKSIASGQVPAIQAEARRRMMSQLEQEIHRLKELQKVNRSVRVEEIEMLVAQQRELDQHLANARLRLDAIRLIQRGPG